MQCFLTTKKLVVLSLGTLLLTGASVKGYALNWTLDVKTLGAGGTTDFTTAKVGPPPYLGIKTAPALAQYSTALIPQAGGNPFTYSTPSNVTYGEIDSFLIPTRPGVGLEAFPVAAAADFFFDVHKGVGTGGPFHTFFAHGVLEGFTTGSAGTIGIVGGQPQSQTRWRLVTLTDVTDGSFLAVDSFDPSTSAPSLLISPVIGGTPLKLWMEKIRQVPAPFASNQLTGFIADVPEPGTVALFIGSGLSGALLLRRRRRA